MSFGFSVGDFIAVGKLIGDIVSCLQDSGGSKEGYQELLRELECLRKALVHLDKLSTGDPATLDSIKYAALICRCPLEEFLAKIRKYDTQLGVWAKPGMVKGSAAKLAWAFSQKKAAQELQIYLNRHVATINLLLAEHSLEKMDLASKEAASNQNALRSILEDTREAVRNISGRFDIQAVIVRNTQRTLARLCDMIRLDFAASWRSLGETVARICIITQQTYTIMLEMKNTMAAPDNRWSFFQDPLAVEDALGCKYPVPSEYDFELFDTVVRHKLSNSPCSRQVQAGNYEYFSTRDSSRTLNVSSRLVPGMEITMAIIINSEILSDEICPMPHCRSQETTQCSGGGRKCCHCNVWFSLSKKPWKPMDDLVSAALGAQATPSEDETRRTMYTASKRIRMRSEEDGYQTLKNIRFSSDMAAHKSGPRLRTEMEGYRESPLMNSEKSSRSPDPDRSFPDKPTIGDSPIMRPPERHNVWSYAAKVQRRCPSKHKLYLEIIKAYARGPMSPQQLHIQISDLFASEPDLIEDFKQFCPDYARNRDFHIAHTYVTQVKRRYIHTLDVYRQFLDTLQSYKEGLLSIQEVYDRLLDLFASEPDLIEDFKLFLPQSISDSRQMTLNNNDATVPSVMQRRKRKRPIEYVEDVGWH